MSNWGALALLLACIVLLFLDKIPFLRRLFERPAAEARLGIEVTMPAETYARLEQVRQEVERHTGRPVSMEEVVTKALEVYDTVVQEHQSGSTFFKRAADGSSTELPIFEERTA